MITEIDKLLPALRMAVQCAEALSSGNWCHIDGPLVQSLAELAQTGEAEYNGCRVERRGRGWRVTIMHGEYAGQYREASDALGALIEAETQPPRHTWTAT